MTSYITIIILTLIYTMSICTIFGSINPWSRKTGAGKIKQNILDWGYKKLGIFTTNFIGLFLTSALQCLPVVVVNQYLLLLSILYPISYSLSYYLFNDKIGKVDNVKEYLWGFLYGLILLMAL